MRITFLYILYIAYQAAIQSHEEKKEKYSEDKKKRTLSAKEEQETKNAITKEIQNEIHKQANGVIIDLYKSLGELYTLEKDSLPQKIEFSKKKFLNDHRFKEYVSETISVSIDIILSMSPMFTLYIPKHDSVKGKTLDQIGENKVDAKSGEEDKEIDYIYLPALVREDDKRQLSRCHAVFKSGEFQLDDFGIGKDKLLENGFGGSWGEDIEKIEGIVKVAKI